MNQNKKPRAKTFHVRHRKWRRLFGDRYSRAERDSLPQAARRGRAEASSNAIVVEGSEGEYYRTLADYIHLNPARAKIIAPRRGECVTKYPWSSLAGGYALRTERRAKWLAGEHGLRAFECEDTTAGRKRYVERLNRRAVEEEARNCGVPLLPEEADARCSHLRRGWYWGSQAFAERLMEAVQVVKRKLKVRGNRSTPERRSHDQRQAEEWLRAGVAATGMEMKEFHRLPGSDPRKVALARLLWEQTTVGQDWIATQLGMGSAANVSQQIRRAKAEKSRPKVPRQLRSFLQSVKK